MVKCVVLAFAALGLVSMGDAFSMGGGMKVRMERGWGEREEED